jgi:DNA invertase Pin-like site-specific DNA recombinase
LGSACLGVGLGWRVAAWSRVARLPATHGQITAKNVWLSLGGSIHDPDDLVGRLLFNVLAMVAGFEADLIRIRIRQA